MISRFIPAQAISASVLSVLTAAVLTAAVGIGHASAQQSALPDEQSVEIERGRYFAELNCSRCHSVDPLAPATRLDAPPSFLDMAAQHYTREQFRQRVTFLPHTPMPRLISSERDFDNLFAYIESLEPAE